MPVHRDNVFNQPTDVAWDSKGNAYFSDGYVNSRVGKVNARGEWVASWGSLGNGPGQFDTPHGIAVSPNDEVFVADRGNRRIQVFDAEGKFLRQFTIDVPVDASEGKVDLRRRAARTPKTGSQAPGAPDALCMTPGPNPVLFVGDLYPSRIYKVSLDGKVLGVYGKPGKQPRRVRLDSRHRLPVGERDLGRRADQLARPEAGDQGQPHQPVVSIAFRDAPVLTPPPAGRNVRLIVQGRGAAERPCSSPRLEPLCDRQANRTLSRAVPTRSRGHG